MELKLIGNTAGNGGGTLNANDAVFGRDYNEALVHQVVIPSRRIPASARARRRIAAR